MALAIDPMDASDIGLDDIDIIEFDPIDPIEPIDAIDDEWRGLKVSLSSCDCRRASIPADMFTSSSSLSWRSSSS